VAWETAGYSVKGAALAGIAAEGLMDSSGIPARTLASYEYAWKGGRDQLTSNDILVIDEAGMVGTRQMARVLEAAEAAHAKVVLVGDPEQLQAIEAGAPFRAMIGLAGAAELNEVRRQNHSWQRTATQQFSKGATPEALAAYASHGATVHSNTRENARSALIALWAKDAKVLPQESRLILAYTRDDVRQLNELAREVRRERGELGHAENIETDRGVRQFAAGDRLYFLGNEKSIGVKNGTLGTIETLNGSVMQVRLDRTGETVSVDTRFYRNFDHGYAATVYKAQSATVDRSYVLATPHFDQHATYVALSRHREAATMFYAAEDFAGKFGWKWVAHDEIHSEVVAALSRARPKYLAHDYLEPSPEDDLTQMQLSSERLVPDVGSDRFSMDSIDARQQAAADRWREKQLARELGASSPEHVRSVDLSDHLELSEDDPLTPQRRNELSRGGLEDDLDL
jgi:Ti-type conjugative transfer relaxase TraA